MSVDRNKEQRCAVLVQIPQHMAAIHVAHDVLNRREREVHMGRVVHHQNDAGDDLQRQTERQNDAPDPHPVQVFRRGDHQGVVHQPNDGQPLGKALFPGRLGFIMVVRNSRHRRFSPLTELDRCGVDKRRDGHRQVCGRRTLPDPAGGVVVRPVARAEPAAKVARIAQRHAAQVRTDTHHHQPLARFVQRAVFVSGVRTHRSVRILGALVRQVRQLNRAGCFNLFSRPATDENRLAQPFHSQLCAGIKAADIDNDRRQGQNVGGRVHLVDQRPNRSTDGNCTCATSGVVQKIATRAFVFFFCVGHGGLLQFPATRNGPIR
mmetsp:Transcript_22443/g.36201  ORF Transcript_22443/g.36201 Transcript_22443/m.36201 type:complete len:320 (+) Transcript_22443:2069-3028(+)